MIILTNEDGSGKILIDIDSVSYVCDTTKNAKKEYNSGGSIIGFKNSDLWIIAKESADEIQTIIMLSKVN